MAIEHAKDVVIGNDEKLGGVCEGLVLGEPSRIGMAVGADDGHATNRGIKAFGDGTSSGIRREEAVCFEEGHEHTCRVNLASDRHMRRLNTMRPNTIHSATSL